jgi:hypothetical protein
MGIGAHERIWPGSPDLLSQQFQRDMRLLDLKSSEYGIHSL